MICALVTSKYKPAKSKTRPYNWKIGITQKKKKENTIVLPIFATKSTQKVVFLKLLFFNGIGTISNSACRSIKEPNHFSLDDAHCKSCTSTALKFHRFFFHFDFT